MPLTRVRSLDQFRGYTVVGMLLVNFLGRYTVSPEWLRHHPDYCTCADTIMPQFFFAAGAAYRLTFCRRLKQSGRAAAIAAAVRRSFGLMLLGFVLYHLDVHIENWADWRRLGISGFLTSAFQRDLFQTLIHIGLAALWIMPVIGAGVRPRLAYLTASVLLHIVLSRLFYFDWVMQRPGIDGGPLGFLTWSVPMLAGSLAYDELLASSPAKASRRLLLFGLVTMLFGYLISCLGSLFSAWTPGTLLALPEPPFIAAARPADLWTMSQRAGSASYQVFCAGWCAALYGVVVWLSDHLKLASSVFCTFGVNALAAYVLHTLIANAIRPLTPRDSPAWFVATSLSLFLLLCWAFIRHLEKQEIYIRM
jgi:predicted acyltransferase